LPAFPAVSGRSVPLLAIAGQLGVRDHPPASTLVPVNHVGFHDLVIVFDLQRYGWAAGRHAARSYPWISPPRTL
jgi:hypothetical protein